MSRFAKGQKIQYETVGRGWVKGVVVTPSIGEGFTEQVEWRVTSRNRTDYPCGLIERTFADSSALVARED